MKQLFLAVTIAFMLGALLSHAAFAESERDVPPPIDLLNLGPEYDVPGNRDARSLPYIEMRDHYPISMKWKVAGTAGFRWGSFARLKILILNA